MHVPHKQVTFGHSDTSSHVLKSDTSDCRVRAREKFDHDNSKTEIYFRSFQITAALLISSWNLLMIKRLKMINNEIFSIRIFAHPVYT